MTGTHKKKFRFEFALGSMLTDQFTLHKAEQIAQTKSIAGFLS